MRVSKAYVEHEKRGPFPGRIDPWSEVGRYFKQIHAGILDNLIDQLDPQLSEMGYRIGREASLQIAEGREPDIFVQRAVSAPHVNVHLDYELAAAEILAEPGVVLEAEVDLQAIHIKQIETGRLVTVIEIISPSNKAKQEIIIDYRARRERLMIERGVNVVEADLTRSIKRLIVDPTVQRYPYHIAVFMPGDSPRFIGVDFDQTIKRVALPLHGEVVPIELQAAYDDAYRKVSIAGQIEDELSYVEDRLPFPSLLSDEQRQQLLQAVHSWREKLTQLRANTNGND
jgi:hypothetical protein